jgi:hypothetical protein
MALISDRKFSGSGTNAYFCPWSYIVGEKVITFDACDDN